MSFRTNVRNLASHELEEILGLRPSVVARNDTTGWIIQVIRNSANAVWRCFARRSFGICARVFLAQTGAECGIGEDADAGGGLASTSSGGTRAGSRHRPGRDRARRVGGDDGHAMFQRRHEAAPAVGCAILIGQQAEVGGTEKRRRPRAHGHVACPVHTLAQARLHDAGFHLLQIGVIGGVRRAHAPTIMNRWASYPVPTRSRQHVHQHFPALAGVEKAEIAEHRRIRGEHNAWRARPSARNLGAGHRGCCCRWGFRPGLGRVPSQRQRIFGIGGDGEIDIFGQGVVHPAAQTQPVRLGEEEGGQQIMKSDSSCSLQVFSRIATTRG